MAEKLPFKSSNFLSGLRVTNQSALASMLDAFSKNSPEAVRNSIFMGGVSTVTNQVSSVLNILADYVYIKGQKSEGQLFADDMDLSSTLALLADLTAIASSASNVETDACLHASAETNELRVNTEKTTENKSKEG